MNPKYKITLCRKDEGCLPIITPFNTGKKTFEKVAEVLYKAQKGEKQR
jgi:hypothetical protein